jgi:hypothetical protein
MKPRPSTRQWVYDAKTDETRLERYKAVVKALKYCRFRCRETHRKDWASIAPDHNAVIEVAMKPGFVTRNDVWDDSHWWVSSAENVTMKQLCTPESHSTHPAVAAHPSPIPIGVRLRIRITHQHHHRMAVGCICGALR